MTMEDMKENIQTPHEVVLRYDAPEAREVVERYIHPDPLPRRFAPVRSPGQFRSAPAASAASARRQPHKGLRTFLCFIALLLIPAAISYLRGHETKQAPSSESHAETQTRGAVETSVPRYPNGEDVRLRLAETHGRLLTIQQIYERVNPCTVTVTVAMNDGAASVGTGVIFSEDGYVLTNAHVIEGGNEVTVVLDNGKMYRDVQLVGSDATNDLAVLKLDAEGLPVAEFGSSDALSVGDTVYAIGNPLGIELRGTLTDGIVSAINRNVEADGVTMTLIQTNAALNNGNSGGPLINVYGQVVGVNTMKKGSRSTVSSANVEGLGFAIPVSSAAWVVDDLIAFGEARGEPVLGILVKAGVLPSGESAVLVHTVEPDSACGDAGVQTGDVIVSADGVSLVSTNDLLRVRRRHRAGETMTLEIDRDGERLILAVTLRTAAD